jgi:hypothetical protein
VPPRAQPGGFRQNFLSGTVWIGEDVRVPEPHDPPTPALQISCAPLIGCRLFEMLASIELNPEPGLTASKIDDERCYDQLPSKGWPIS